MTKKGALELSVNAIVILIIALTVLGLVIGFTVSKFTSLSGEVTYTGVTQEATPKIPIQFPGGTNAITLSKGKSTRAILSIYNPSPRVIDLTPGGSSEIDVKCQGGVIYSDGINVTASKVIDAGSISELPVLITIPSDTAIAELTCVFNIKDATGIQVTRGMFITIE